MATNSLGLENGKVSLTEREAYRSKQFEGENIFKVLRFIGKIRQFLKNA